LQLLLVMTAVVDMQIMRAGDNAVGQDKWH
jgi:hypothetical protein